MSQPSVREGVQLAFSILASVINFQAYLILGDPSRISAANCQRAIRLFGDLDLSLPRALVPQDLERRFSWPPGAGLKLLNALSDLGILSSLSHGRLSGGGMAMWIVAKEFSWSPRSLADQWKRSQVAEARASVAQHI